MAAFQRWPAFSLSLIFHIAVIGFVLWVDIAFAPPPSPRYDVLAIPPKAPEDAKIIWYKSRKPLPEIAPDHAFGPSPTPRGEKDPSRTLVTVSKDAASTHQLIRQPEQPKLLLTDVPAPNLVAVSPKLPPKVFVPPPAPKPPPTAAIKVAEPPPAMDAPRTQATNALGAMTALQKLPPKTFVPPAAQASGKPAPHVDAPAAPAMDAQSSQLPGLQAVMVGLNPAAALPPPGSRPGQIARAPDAGIPSSGTLAPANASIVPGVFSRGSPSQLSAPTVPPPLSALNPLNRPPPQEIVLPPVNRTMSAPLRPSSRLIPPALEARFAGRNVYTLVIPGPTLARYGGDWVLWFAEREPGSDGGARISAPIPARKYSTDNGAPSSAGLPVSFVQFAAVIDKAGHIGSALVIRGPADPVLRSRALEELGSWEFKPTLHNGEPVAADVVLEIRFRFPSTIEASH